MKKDIKESVPQTPSQPASNIKTFFTKEINEQILDMSSKEMESLIKEMVDSRQFIAILKYNSLRMPLLDATLRGTDPIKDPSKISWSQGAMAGLSDLETYIIDLNAPKALVEEPEEGQPASGNPEGVIIG